MRRKKTDSPIAQPLSVVRRPGQGYRAALRAVARFRCPHCGVGAVIARHFSTHDHCTSCGFRFKRDRDPAYFNGAMFVNYMMSAGLFVVTFFIIIMTSRPDVPWDSIAIGAPLVAIAAVVLFYPISKMIWLVADVMLRPVTEDELGLPAVAPPKAPSSASR
jgi:uncharacterized protein (DUF983 family)